MLSALESRKGIERLERINMMDIVDDVGQGMLPLLEKKRLSFETGGDGACSFAGQGAARGVYLLYTPAVQRGAAGNKGPSLRVGVPFGPPTARGSVV